MKKLVSALMAMAMCLTLAACGGGVDKQPAIDAFNSANTDFAALAQEMNANIDAYSEEFVNLMVEMGNTMADAKALLEGDKELTEEQVADLVTQLGDLKAWVADVNAELANPNSELYKQEEAGLLESDELPAADVLDYFGTLTERFDVIANLVSDDPSAFEDAFLDEVVTVSESMDMYRQIMESIDQLGQEELLLTVEGLAELDMWMQAVESQLQLG